MSDNEKYYDYCTCNDSAFHVWDEGICPFCAELDLIESIPDDCDCEDGECSAGYCDCSGNDECENCCDDG